MAADRDLLDGLLALQIGLIDRGQLVAALHAWAGDRSRSLADHLVALGHLGAAHRPAVEAIATVHLETHGGDAGKSLASLTTGLSARETLAAIGDPEIEQTLSQLASGPDGDADRTIDYAVGAATSDGQRFRILRPHAHGGLGAVFVALDAELHREVALKQILERHADDPISRSRFLLEAEITGSLEHPGIVPVHGLGTDADGRPYYAMRFIRGDSLKEAAVRFHADEGLKTDPGRRSLELRKLLRRFTDVCNAIDYAHSRGVLHRDLKPSNVIVGKHGETLVVDWGLAKATGRNDAGADLDEQALVPSSASGSAETLPGRALGTPAYMSPEQAEGDLEHLGTRSDVYSLGATLYYLLTGRQPVEGTIAVVLDAVKRGEIRPPRQVAPTIDRALEAVCLRAMAHRPEDRYASARALAEDVERWMADEPVSAWREPLSRRARRWARRNRTAVTALAAAVLVALAGTAAVLAVQTQANADLKAANADLYAANARAASANADLSRSKEEVQARYELAVEAIKTFHTGVSEDFLLKQMPFKDLRDRLLKSASDFYGKLGALLGRETDLGSRRALAASNYELAELTAKVGRPADALAAHRAVLAAREAMADEPGVDPGAVADVGRSLTAVATLLEGLGRSDEAVATYRRAEARLPGPSDSEPADPRVRAALGDCRSRLGYLLYSTGHAADGLAVLRRARSDQEPPAAAPGASPEARRELANTINRIANVLSRTGRPAEAEAAYGEAMAIYRGLIAEDPARPEFRRRQGMVYNNLGSLLLNILGRPVEGEAAFREAMAIKQKLADENPAVTDFRNDLALSHRNLGEALNQLERHAEAEAQYRETIDLYGKLVAEAPAVAEFRGNLADGHSSLAFLLYQTGRTAEAVDQFRRAMAIRQALADEAPAVTKLRSDLARSRHNLGYILAEAGQPAAAEAELRAARAICRALADADPTVTGFRADLASNDLDLGILLAQTGRPAESEAVQRGVVALYRKLVDDNPRPPALRVGLAGAFYSLGDVVRALGRPAEARDAYERAIAIQQGLVEGGRNPWYRSLLAHSLRRRALALRDLGDPAAAADARRALDLLGGLPAPSGEDRFESACARATLAGLAGSAGSGISSGEARREADAAMALLREAAAMGYRNAGAFRTDAALDPLRDRPDFHSLMMDLEFPAEPFAPGR